MKNSLALSPFFFRLARQLKKSLILSVAFLMASSLLSHHILAVSLDDDSSASLQDLLAQELLSSGALEEEVFALLASERLGQRGKITVLTQLFLEVFEDIVDGSRITPEDLHFLAEATVICHNTQIARNRCSVEKKEKKTDVGAGAAVIEANRESSESSDATSCISWCEDKSAEQMQEDHGISQPSKNNKNPDHHPAPLLTPPAPENSSAQPTSPPPTQKAPTNKEDIPTIDVDALIVI